MYVLYKLSTRLDYLAELQGWGNNTSTADFKKDSKAETREVAKQFAVDSNYNPAFYISVGS